MTAKAKATLTTDINTLLANNVAGDIEASELNQLMDDIVDSTLGGYGAISTVGASTAQGLTTSFAKLTGFTANGLGVNTTPDHANDQITVLVAGDYEVSFMLQGTGAAGTYTFAPSVGGTESTVYQTVHTPTGAETFSVSLVCPLTLAANDIITVEGKASSSINYTLRNAQLFVRRLA
jgi:hypothetical protein